MTNWRTIRIRSGQSIVFMAVLLLVLIGFAGLSIDTGKAFQQQRTIQAGSNSAAVAGMNQVVLNQLDSQVQTTIVQSMEGNGGRNVTQVGGVGTNQHNWGTNLDTVYFRAMYLDKYGNYINDVGNLGTSPPSALDNPAVTYVQVISFEPVSTTFMKAVGTERLNVSAEGLAGLSDCRLGVMPLTFHESNINGITKLDARFWDAEVATIRSNHASSVFTVAGSPPSSGNFLFVEWLAQTSTGPALKEGWTGTGTLIDGFEEDDPPADDIDYQDSISKMNGTLEPGDWLAGQPGNPSTIGHANFTWHITNKTKLILPLYDRAAGTGSGGSYHVTKLVKVRLLDFKLTPVPQRFFEFALLQEQAKCSGLVPPPPSTIDGPTKHIFTVQVEEVLKWKADTLADADVVLVMDFSSSMKDCWGSATNCPGSQRYQTAQAFARTFASSVLAPGHNNRMSVIAFGLKTGPRVAPESARQLTPGYVTTDTEVHAAVNGVRANQMNGNTATALGLNEAYNLIYTNPRTGAQPIVILVTDGLTNVLYEGPARGQTNHRELRPYFCGSDLPATVDEKEDPYTQAVCPPPSTDSEPPIESAIKVADRSRIQNINTRTFAVVIGEPDGLTVSDRYLDRMAAHTFVANNPTDMNNLANTMASLVIDNCVPQYDPARIAAGAQVTITTAEGTAIGEYPVNDNGQVVVELDEGEHIMRGSHLGVVSPNDITGTPQNYTRLRTLGSTQATSILTFNMPNQDYIHEPIQLVIDDENNVACSNLPVPPNQ